MAPVQTKRAPKYLGIARQLRQRIDRGELAVGARLAGEHELAAHYGVHRLTARRALDELAREGLLDRSPGRGTYVAAQTAPPRQIGADSCVGLAFRAAGHFYADEARLLVSRLQQRGLLSILLDLSQAEGLPPEETAAAAAPILRQVLGMDLAAVIIDGGYFDVALTLEPALGKHRPLIVMNRLTRDPATLDCPTLHSVTCDYRAAGQMVARHLLDQGHRRLLLCGYGRVDPQRPWTLREDMDWSEREFHAGCCDALAEYQLEPAAALRLVMNVSTRHEPQPDLGPVLRGPVRPTAAIVLGDFRAPRLYDAAAAEGLVIGRDLAVVGFFDTPWATSLRPLLTSVNLRPEVLAAELDDLIAQLTENPRRPAQHRHIRPQLVIRESSAGANPERSRT